MDKDDSNKQIDDDIQQCKADILRAGDIMPPYDKKTELSENKAGQSSQKTTKKEAEEKASLAEEELILLEEETEEETSFEDTSVIPIKTIDSKPPAPEPVSAEKIDETETTTRPQEQSGIPKLDLAEQILAKQRKISSVRRKSPDQKGKVAKPGAKAVGYMIEQPTSAMLEQDQIIVDIVARDIERLCYGKLLSA